MNAGIPLSATPPAIPFAVRYAGFVLTRFTVRPDGRTSFQYLLGAPYVSRLFGDSVLAMIPDHEVRAAKLTNRWISGCWWGPISICSCADQSAENHLENSGTVEKRWRHVARSGILIWKRTLEFQHRWKQEDPWNFLHHQHRYLRHNMTVKNLCVTKSMCARESSESVLN